MAGKGDAERCAAQRGFSMLELLVALLVTSIGVLGVVGMTALNAQHRRSAATHSEAVRLAQDMIERIRANPAGLQLGSYAASGDGAGASDCRTGHCPAAEMAAFDLAEWRCALGEAAMEQNCRGPLDATGTVAADAATGSVRITIRWLNQGESQVLTIDGGI